jgi:excinuclease ABC subunit A
VLESLVDKGNTVIVIEHNLDVVKTADWIIDMGPEGGHKGGSVVAVGTPEELAETPESHTGQWLRHVLGLDGPATGTAPRTVTSRAAKANGSATKASTKTVAVKAASKTIAAPKKKAAPAKASRSAKV